MVLVAAAAVALSVSAHPVAVIHHHAVVVRATLAVRRVSAALVVDVLALVLLLPVRVVGHDGRALELLHHAVELALLEHAHLHRLALAVEHRALPVLQQRALLEAAAIRHHSVLLHHQDAVAVVVLLNVAVALLPINPLALEHRLAVCVI